MSIGKSFHLPAIQLRDFVPIKKIGMMEDGNNGFWGVNGMGDGKNQPPAVQTVAVLLLARIWRLS